jgi:hypothetical protein
LTRKTFLDLITIELPALDLPWSSLLRDVHLGTQLRHPCPLPRPFLYSSKMTSPSLLNSFDRPPSSSSTSSPTPTDPLSLPSLSSISPSSSPSLHSSTRPLTSTTSLFQTPLEPLDWLSSFPLSPSPLSALSTSHPRTTVLLYLGSTSQSSSTFTSIFAALPISLLAIRPLAVAPSFFPLSILFASRSTCTGSATSRGPAGTATKRMAGQDGSTVGLD